MKKILVFLLMILAGGLVHADPYGYGETVPIPFVSIDTATGEPVAATLIKIAIYYQSSTTAVVAETDMSNWNSQTGEYYYNFTTPDSSGVYTPRVRWQAQGAEYILWLDNIYVAEIFDVDVDTIFANVTNPVVVYDTNTAGEEIAIMPDWWTAADSGAYQGSAAGLSAAEIMDSLFDRVVADTVTGSYLAELFKLAGGSGSTDTSMIKTMLINNLFARLSQDTTIYITAGGLVIPDSVIVKAIKETVIGFVEDSIYANRADYMADVSALATASNLSLALDSLGKILDSLYAVLDTLQNQDDWIALQSDMTKSLDSLGKAIDSLESNAVRRELIKDSTDAIITYLRTYLDAAVSGISSTWSTGQRDSVLSAVTNAAFISKIWNVAFSTGFTAGSMGDSLTNTSFVQGTASGLSVADIWAYSGGRTIDGGYVDSNKTEQGGSAGGDGTYSWSVLVIDTSSGGTIAVQQAKISINNLTQSGVPYHDLTDNTGLANGFNLDAGTWVVIFNEPGYKSIIDTITVSAIGADTIYTYTSNANKTVVFGTLMDSRGQYAAYGRVKFKAVPYPGDSLIYKGDTVVTQTIVEDTANAYGYVSIPLIANANYTSPDSTYYQVSIYNRYGQLLERPFYCIVPDTTSIAITDLTKWRR